MDRGPDALTALISEPEDPKHYNSIKEMQKELNELDLDLKTVKKAFEEIPLDPLIRSNGLKFCLIRL
jgi:hypothetical protein